MVNSPHKRRVSDKDFKRIAEYIHKLWKSRKSADTRKEKEKQWKEVDRQVAMTPLPLVDDKGRNVNNTAWMSNLELPLQAQALEVLNADGRRLLFPDDKSSYVAHAATTDEYLQRVDFQNLIAGDENEVPSQINQENADALAEASVAHFHAQYDFRGVWDLLNAEAFKYGTLVGRAKLVTLDKHDNQYRGIIRDKSRIPVLVPRSIKNTYLDDSLHAVMHEGMMIGPATIEHTTVKLEDLRKAARKGSADPKRENGGWMPAALAGLREESKTKPTVNAIEYEGDLLIPRTSGPPIFLANVMVNVAVGKSGPKMYRYREREFPFRSYLIHDYHKPDVDSPYGTGPLMMGSPVHKAATEAFNALMNAGAFNIRPPVKWDPSDQYMQATGGPVLEPGAKWPGQSNVEAIDIGDPTAMSQIFFALVRMYEEVTGVTKPRTGGQTKSHQTAFAVDSEITRGVIRTVDYVRSLMFGPMPTFLSMEYEMAKKALGKNTHVYVPRYQAYVQIGPEHLPDTVTWEVFGAAGPLEEREKEQKKQQALKGVMELEPLVVQAGGTPMNYDELRRQMLHDGGFTDADPFFQVSPNASPDAGVPGVGEDVPTDPRDALAAVATG